MFFLRKTKIKVLGRAGIQYSEHGKTLVIDSELMADGVMHIFSVPAQWTVPHQDDRITEEQRARILTKTMEYLKKRHYGVELHLRKG